MMAPVAAEKELPSYPCLLPVMFSSYLCPVPIPSLSCSCPIPILCLFHPCPTCHRRPGDNGWPQGTEGVKGFPQQPLPPVSPHLPVASAHVIGHSEAQHVLQCRCFLGTAGTCLQGDIPTEPQVRQGPGQGVPQCVAPSSQ